MSLIQI